jgi:hypothetical protein
MSLLSDTRVPKETEGIGYKLVHRGPEKGTYLPEWPYFAKDGTGGMNRPQRGKPSFASSMVYKLGETTECRSRRKARTYSGKLYRAGIHLYLAEVFAHTWREDLVTLECTYKRALITDFIVVVALEITPIREIKNGSAY